LLICLSQCHWAATSGTGDNAKIFIVKA
jgi:hypothetical protein